MQLILGNYQRASLLRRWGASPGCGSHHQAHYPAYHQPPIVAHLCHHHQRHGTSSGTFSGHQVSSSGLEKGQHGRHKSSGTSSGCQLGTSLIVINGRAHLRAHYNQHYRQGSSPCTSSRLQWVMQSFTEWLHLRGKLQATDPASSQRINEASFTGLQTGYIIQNCFRLPRRHWLVFNHSRSSSSGKHFRLQIGIFVTSMAQ